MLVHILTFKQIKPIKIFNYMDYKVNVSLGITPHISGIMGIAELLIKLEINGFWISI